MQWVKLVLSVIVIFTVTCRNAHAYLDPGTGSYIFQALIVGVLAAAFSLKMMWKRLVEQVGSFFSRFKKQ